MLLLALQARGTAAQTPLAADERAPSEVSVALSTSFPRPSEAFREALAIIQRDSYNADVTDEVAYYAALSGVLRHLSPESNKDLLELRTPALHKVRSKTAEGKGASIGVGLNVVESLLLITDVVPGSPAERAGLRLRDRIAVIDGDPLGGKTLGEAEALLQRPPGSRLLLTIEREGRRFDVELACEELEAKDVRASILRGVGVLRLLHFSASGLRDFDGELARLKGFGVSSLVVDLRGNPGGVVDVATRTACAFLPGGAVVLRTAHRDRRLVRSVCLEDGDTSTPLVILVNRETASSAEVFTAALQENGRARVLGERTRGSGALKEVKTLRNGYAFTLLTGVFYGPRRGTWLGRGLAPDQDFRLTPAGLEAARMEPEEGPRLKLDAPLAAALAILQRAQTPASSGSSSAPK